VHACTHSYHDEILNFTGVERTNNEINAHLFDNVNDYMIKKQQGGKNFNDGRMKKINPSIMGVGRNLSRGGNIDILLIFFKLLTMLWKWTLTKPFTLSTP